MNKQGITLEVVDSATSEEVDLMSVDLRFGRQDYYIRYKIYSMDVKPSEVLKNRQNFESQIIGVFRAKDVTPNTVNFNNINNIGLSKNQSITIETMDRVSLSPNQVIFNTADESFYIIKEVQEETLNQYQSMSRRPITKRTITLRKGK